jgi:beta-hydroxyacyl-[acyl carrier protein] dehydratase FabZ
MLSVKEIQELLPHRYPFLLVDRIIELEPLKRAVGVKNVTINELHFLGHFPNKPVMPGVLILEAMAQIGGIAMLYSEEHRGKLAYFARINKVKFFQQVIPGDQIRIVTEVLQVRGTMGKIWAQSFVEDKVVAEGEFLFVVSNK